jgi:hypothetical protein
MMKLHEKIIWALGLIVATTFGTSIIFFGIVEVGIEMIFGMKNHGLELFHFQIVFFLMSLVVVYRGIFLGKRW